jgi:hypothetical protein
MKFTKTLICILLFLVLIIILFNTYSNKTEQFKEGMESNENVPTQSGGTEYTEAPPEYTEAPPEYTEAPPEYTEAPPEYTEAPPEYTEAPPEPTTPEPAGNIFDANKYINSNCNNDSNCQIYYSSILINAPNYNSNYDRGGNSNNSSSDKNEKDSKKKDKNEDKDEEDSSRRRDKIKNKLSEKKDKAHKWLSSLHNTPRWRRSDEDSSDEDSSDDENEPTGNSADYYSYYGALPSKGADFLPVNSDFSSFRK